VLVALGVPLAVNLNQRATLQLQTDSLVRAQYIANAVGAENLRPKNEPRLKEIVDQASGYVGGRVLVVNENGVVLADSQTPPQVGTNYATAGRPEILSALRGQPDSIIRHSVDLGTDLMTTAVPIQDEGHTYGAVRITQTIAEVRSQTRRTTIGLIAIGLAGLTGGLLLAFGIAGSLSRPLRKLADTSERLGTGDLSARAEGVGGGREVEELGRSFDEMADRLERTVQAQREFIANASHQLRTPLTGIKLRIESAIEDAQSDDLRRQLEAADREVDRLSEIVDRLLVMAREVEEGRPTQVDLADAVARALARWEERAELRGASLVARGGGGTAQANPADLDQILDNLLDNAISYSSGEIAIETSREDGSVLLAVTDHGPGIPADEIERVTDRFYRGRGAPSGGSGLGLPIARQLAEKWGGTLAVSSPKDGGARIEVSLRSADA
jgi:two-component system, OmpR family, sensor kinase